MPKVDLSVIVIGRNESQQLPQLCKSLEQLRYGPLTTEFIYVDSASDDKSVEIAAGHFDRVVVLGCDERLNASAGRYIGQKFAKGEWVLFLDGDMVLCPDFCPVLYGHVSSINQGLNEVSGLVGVYVNHLDSGAVVRWTPRSNGNKGVDHFGGAVLLPMSFLVEESWNPRLFSNEEIDLLTRLKAKNLCVVGVNRDFVEHHTEYYSAFVKLRDNLLPYRTNLGKKFFGIGQLLRTRVREGGGLKLIRGFPEPFVVWFSFLLSLSLMALSYYVVGAIVLLFGFLFVRSRKPSSFYILYLTFGSQAIWGWSRYIADWEPKVQHILEVNKD